MLVASWSLGRPKTCARRRALQMLMALRDRSLVHASSYCAWEEGVGASTIKAACQLRSQAKARRRRAGPSGNAGERGRVSHRRLLPVCRRWHDCRGGGGGARPVPSDWQQVGRCIGAHRGGSHAHAARARPCVYARRAYSVCINWSATALHARWHAPCMVGHR